MQVEGGTALQILAWCGALIVGAFTIRGAYERALQRMSAETGNLKLELVKELSGLRTDIQLLQQSHQTAINHVGERITRVEEQQKGLHDEVERQRDRANRTSKDVAHLQGALNLPIRHADVDNKQGPL